MKDKGSSKKTTLTLKFLVMVILGMVCGFYLGLFIGYSTDVGDSFLLKTIIYLWVAIFLQTIFHELGHLVCGLLTGYHFASFRIGSVMLVKKDGKIQLKRFSLMGTGGQCLMSPPDFVDGKIPYVWYNFGGSLFNIIVSGIALGLYWLLRDISILQPLFILIAIIGIAFALMNGIPMRLGAVNNDGYNAVSLSKSADVLKYFWVQLKVNALTTDGTRLKDMPDDWFIIPSEEALKNSICASTGVLACSRAIDQMNFEPAKQIAKQLLDTPELIEIYRGVITTELIFCELVSGSGKDTVDALFSKEFRKYKQAMRNYPSVIRMQYAYELLANCDEKAAEKQLIKFEKAAKTYPHACEIESERELIAAIKLTSLT